ncbi:MAG: HAMP domain-containing protein [Planctomycetes bacterium]|nr:HAMP domain-containing protein [Planctomycetota bacterium]
MIDRLRSVRLRLTFWYTGALGALLLVFAAATSWFTQDRLVMELDQQLASDLATVQSVIEDNPDELDELEEHGAVARFRVSKGQETVHETTLWRALPPSAIIASESSALAFECRDANGHAFRIQHSTIEVGEQTYQIAVARDASAIEQAIRSLRRTLLFAYPVALLLAFFGGLVLADRMLAPVGVMARRVEQITAERLGERLPVANPSDEFGRLAGVFNTMLARLENSFARLRRFTADASHELRTPLTAMRSVGEVALRDSKDLSAYREAIGSMLEETDRLTHLVESLLTLTRADSGTDVLTVETVDLAAIITEVAEYLRPLAEERSQTLSVTANEGAIANVNRLTIRQAVVNLLDNAIKYTQVGGMISIACRRFKDNEIVVEVADNGPGIPREEHDRIFERFYRVDKSRSREMGGVGLGLSIARWSLEANGGTVEIESDGQSGSIFRIRLSTPRRAILGIARSGDAYSI